MKVVITGANGFLGSWTVFAFLDAGYEVHALGRNLSKFQEASHDRLFVHSLPVEKWSQLLRVEKPDFVVHCDWAGVASSDKNDIEQHLNVTRWLNLASTEIEIGVKKSVFLGSQAEFGTSLGIIPEETNEFSPNTQYGIAKCDAYNNLNTLFLDTNSKFVWARLFSSYGALDDGAWLIPSCFRDLMSGRNFYLSSGEQEWNYLHGADIGRALVSIIDDIDFSGAVNIAHPKSTQIKVIANQIETLLNLHDLISFTQDEGSKIPDVLPDSRRLHQLGWKPIIGIHSGLELTAQWVKGEKQTLKEYGFQNLQIELFSKTS